MLITLTDEQKVTLTLNPRTAGTSTNPNGNPAQVDGVPQWSVTEGDVTLEAAEDGMSATVFSGAANVNSKVSVSADADLGEGVSTIEDVLDVAVVAASASALGINAGTPEQK